MKKILAITVTSAFLSGCVPLLMTKEIQVKKDGNGKIIETIEIERATQNGSSEGFQFDHLKSHGTKESPVQVYH